MTRSRAWLKQWVGSLTPWQKRMDWNIKQYEGYVCKNNYMNEVCSVSYMLLSTLTDWACLIKGRVNGGVVCLSNDITSELKLSRYIHLWEKPQSVQTNTACGSVSSVISNLLAVGVSLPKVSMLHIPILLLQNCLLIQSGLEPIKCP